MLLQVVVLTVPGIVIYFCLSPDIALHKSRMVLVKVSKQSVKLRFIFIAMKKSQLPAEIREWFIRG